MKVAAFARQDLENCAVCGAAMKYLNGWILACHKCGFQASTLSPAEGTGIPGLEELRRENFEHLLDRMVEVRELSDLRILEVGSAWGWFLEAATKRGAIVRGIEPEFRNAELCRSAGFDVEVGYFPDDLRDKGPYDVIVFNDVFEHLPQPERVIKDVEALLSPGGLVVINYPSSNGALFRIANVLSVFGAGGALDRLWQKGLPSPHVSYFNPSNLTTLVTSQTFLRPVKRFALKTVSRVGLTERVGASHRGFKGRITVAILWMLSFVLPRLPADIEVGIFQAPR